MAHALRLKLQARYLSPPLASKLLDPRHVPWRCYGENALLESSCNSTLNANDIDGESNGGGDLTGKGEDKASKESNLDKLTNSICDKVWAKANVARGEKDKGFQGQSDLKESKKVLKDEWHEVVSSVRTMLHKSKAKGDELGPLGVPKTEANEDQRDFSDLDLPEAGGEFGGSRGPNASNKDSLVASAFGKRKTKQLQLSQKPKDTKLLSFLESLDDNTTLSSPDDNSSTTQTEISKQKPKDTKLLSFLESLDDNTTLSSPDDNSSTTQTEISKNKTAHLFTKTDFMKPSNLQNKNQPRNNDAMPGSVDSKMSKGKDSALPRAAEDGSNAQIWSESSCKDTTQITSDFKAEGSGNAPPAQLHGNFCSHVSEATPQPFRNDNSIPNTGYMVCVQNLPSSCNPAIIKAAMAVHGEVLGFYKKAVRSGVFNVYIQFKTAESMEAAIAAQKLQTGSKSFFIARTDQVFSTVARLSKVHKDTTAKQLLLICGKYGRVDNIRKRSTGTFDVFYQVDERPNMTRILERLNDVTINRVTWIAIPAPTLHPSVQKEALKTPEGQAWHEIQVHHALNRIEIGIDGVSVLFEDLKELTALGKEFSKR